MSISTILLAMSGSEYVMDVSTKVTFFSALTNLFDYIGVKYTRYPGDVTVEGVVDADFDTTLGIAHITLSGDVVITVGQRTVDVMTPVGDYTITLKSNEGTLKVHIHGDWARISWR